MTAASIPRPGLLLLMMLQEQQHRDDHAVRMNKSRSTQSPQFRHHLSPCLLFAMADKS